MDLSRRTGDRHEEKRLLAAVGRTELYEDIEGEVEGISSPTPVRLECFLSDASEPGERCSRRN